MLIFCRLWLHQYGQSLRGESLRTRTSRVWIHALWIHNPLLYHWASSAILINRTQNNGQNNFFSKYVSLLSHFANRPLKQKHTKFFLINLRMYKNMVIGFIYKGHHLFCVYNFAFFISCLKCLPKEFIITFFNGVCLSKLFSNRTWQK